MSSPIRRVLFGALIFAAIPAVVLAGLPWPWALRWVPPGKTAMMLHREKEARRAGEPLELQRVWVPLEEMPEHLIRAVTLAEDDRFREHGGIDWKALGDEVEYPGDEQFSWTDAEDRAALREALRYGWEHRSELRGRSTITQQLAKNLYFGPDRAVLRKFAEVVVAIRLERFLGKDRILEIYLNTVELGEGVFGVGAGAQVHFGVPAAELTRFQSASLAATLPHPLTSNPSYRPSRMAWRRDLILSRLSGSNVTIPDAPPAIETPVLVPEPVLPEPEPVIPDAPLPTDSTPRG